MMNLKEPLLNNPRNKGFLRLKFRFHLEKTVYLKAARVYMVFGVLEKLGEIIKSTPPVEQLEEEQFDQNFTVTIVTKETSAEIENKVMKVSEVEKVEVSSITLTDSNNEIQSRSLESKTSNWNL